MALGLVPSSLVRLSSLLEDEEMWPAIGSGATGLSVTEDQNNVYVDAAVPGVDADNVDVTFEKGVLTITAKQEEKEENKKRKVYREFSRNFSYRAAMPVEVDSDKITAEVKDGVVYVTLPKSAHVQPKKVSVTKK
ncbi:MAG: hypothetical protein KatS3mg087_1010 [Patescibacteria group bacterium]|nr:MAG: hypothetical protein KatS3mg087_1010 [Patescibacteria group bacterium]